MPYISTVSFDIWQATPPRSSARTTTKQPYALIEEAWGEFWAYSWVHKRSPWLVEDGCSVRHSAQVQQLQTHQRFFQVAFAHILRRQGDNEGVGQRWDGQWVHREGLSQGRGSSHLRWWHSSSNVLYGLRTWQSSTMTIYANGRAFQSVGEVQHSKSLSDISTFLNSSSGCQNSTWVDYGFHPSTWCYMDPELASRSGKTGFEGCRQVNRYGQPLYDDPATMSLFQATKMR